jgi:LacI family transcriptional regulator
VQRSRLAGLVLTAPMSERRDLIRRCRARHQAGAHHRRHRRPGRRACVFVDDREAAYEITEHLIQLGHQRIGFLGRQSHRSRASAMPVTSAR